MPLFAGGPPNLEGKYSEISGAISCIYFFTLRQSDVGSTKGLLNAQSKLRKLLQDQTLDGERLYEAIRISVAGLARERKLEHSIETDRFFCLSLLEEQDRNIHLKKK